ncbi:hypothetical protein BR93DRAFT_970255 [Coniochaeta sp. PMI_546]|nr:hypothetical protein BR93DRAFT_970255 [Coniochaeta sp. PMI_546]
MRLYTIVSTLVGVAITLGNPIATLSDLVPADIYALNVAPIHLARLEAYKFDNAGTLTSEQAAVLDHAISVIRTQAVAEEPAVRHQQHDHP